MTPHPQPSSPPVHPIHDKRSSLRLLRSIAIRRTGQGRQIFFPRAVAGSWEARFKQMRMTRVALELIAPRHHGCARCTRVVDTPITGCAPFPPARSSVFFFSCMALYGTVISFPFSHVVIRRVPLLLCAVAGLLCLWLKSQFQLATREAYQLLFRVPSPKCPSTCTVCGSS